MALREVREPEVSGERESGLLGNNGSSALEAVGVRAGAEVVLIGMEESELGSRRRPLLPLDEASGEKLCRGKGVVGRLMVLWGEAFLWFE